MAESEQALISYRLDDGVLIATIDMPGRAMNVFSQALMDALEAFIARLHSDNEVVAAVITSGKAAFVAGADLEMVQGFARMAETDTPSRLHEVAGRLGRVFNRLEATTKPVVAALNGLALGGGLELAMACSYRIVADDPKIQLGLPEIKLGLLPGAGGTQRAPRLVGVEQGLKLLLDGQPRSPGEAKALGLVDEVAPAQGLLMRAVEKARELSASGAWARPLTHLDPGPFDFSTPDAARRTLSAFGYHDDVVARYPAYLAIARCVIEGANMPIPEGSDNEMARFVELMLEGTAGVMVNTLFLARQRADKAVARRQERSELRVNVDASGEMAELLAALLKKTGAWGEGDAALRVVSAPEGVLTLVSRPDDAAPPATADLFVGRSALGVAIEIIADDNASREAALDLAKKIRATPFIHGGRGSLLATVSAADVAARAAGKNEDEVMRAQAAAAAAYRMRHDIPDTDLADVACVVAGVSPAFTGGPFTHFRRNARRRAS